MTESWHSLRPTSGPAMAGAVIGLALAAAAAQAAVGLYDTGRYLPHTDNECAGQKAKDCITVASPVLSVARGGSRLITLACTARFPHLVGWDSAQHEHLRLVVTAGDPAAKAAAAATGPDRLSVAMLNNGNAVGSARLYAGCSRQPWAGTPFMSTREGVPGNHAGFVGGRP